MNNETCKGCGHEVRQHRWDGSQWRCLRETCRPDHGGKWCYGKGK